jgi:copper chaperone CopZ
MKYKFKTNMVCQHCIKTVTPHLNALDFVDLWHVDLDHEDKILYVDLDEDDPDKVLNAVHDAGFQAEIIAPEN